jgi:hypothetical protein
MIGALHTFLVEKMWIGQISHWDGSGCVMSGKIHAILIRVSSPDKFVGMD